MYICNIEGLAQDFHPEGMGIFVALDDYLHQGSKLYLKEVNFKGL